MNKSIKKNYIYNVICQVLLIFLSTIIAPYLSRVLGPSGVGTYSYTISVVTYFVLLGSLGISAYGQREIAYVQNDIKKRSKLFFELIIIKIITSFISMLLFYLFFVRNSEYSCYYKILILEILASILDITWFYQGMELFKKNLYRNIIFKLISVILIFLFVKNKDDLNIYLIIYVLSNLIGNLSFWLDIKKYIEIPNKLELFKHLKSVLIFFIPQLAIKLYTILNKVVMGNILNDMSEVGYYEQSEKIIRLLLTLITALGSVMMSRISNVYAKKDYDKMKNYLSKAFSFIFLIGLPMVFGIIAVSKNFAPIFFGEGYDKVPSLMNIMSIIIIFIGIGNVIGTQYLIPTKKEKEYIISVIMGAITNVIFNLLLIKTYKSYGASISTVLTELMVVSTQIYFVRKDFEIKKLFSKIYKYLISSIIMFIICILIDKLIISQLLSLIIQVIIGIIVYAISLIILKDEYFINILESLKKSK